MCSHGNSGLSSVSTSCCSAHGSAVHLPPTGPCGGPGSGLESIRTRPTATAATNTAVAATINHRPIRRGACSADPAFILMSSHPPVPALPSADSSPDGGPDGVGGSWGARTHGQRWRSGCRFPKLPCRVPAVSHPSRYLLALHQEG